MTHDEAEFLISQQLDGTLEAVDEMRLRVAIDADAIVAAMWREHQTLDAALRESRVRIEALSSDAADLFSQIAARIDEDESVETPPTSFKLSNYRWTTPLAAAAMLAIGLTIGIVATRGGNRSSVSNGPEMAKMPVPAPVESVAAAIRTITLNGNDGDAVIDLATSNGFADVTVGTPMNLTPAYVASLYGADHFGTDRVVIEAAGRYVPDTFE